MAVSLSHQRPEPGRRKRRCARPIWTALRRHSILFHPDCDRRLRSCTESADPSGRKPEERSRAQATAALASGAFTAGGDFHPAPRTGHAVWRGGSDASACRPACRRWRTEGAVLNRILENQISLDFSSPDRGGAPRRVAGSVGLRSAGCFRRGSRPECRFP